MATTTTGAVNEALYYLLVFCALLFVAIVFFMVLFLVRYRTSRNPRPTEMHGNPLFEVGVIVLSTILALSFFWYGFTGYQYLRRVPEGALQVSVHSKQFSWSFEYSDGRIAPDLVVPVGSDVRLNVTSDDVLHGFYLPAMRVQVDAVPGQETYAWFRAKDLGAFDILCTVYCGTAHSAMLAKLYVVTQADFQKWKAGEELPALGGAVATGAKSEGERLLDGFGCLSCHSTDGSSGIGPTLKGLFGSRQTVVSGGSKKQVTVDEAFLARAISQPHDEVAEGFEDIMPDLDDTLRPGDVDEMVKAIISLE
jgi:cytochrome c oxidase subunit 2